MPSSPVLPASPRVTTSQIVASSPPDAPPPQASDHQTPTAIAPTATTTIVPHETVDAYLQAIPALYRNSDQVFTHVNLDIDCDIPLLSAFLTQIKKVPRPRVQARPMARLERGYWTIDPVAVGLTSKEFKHLWKKLCLLVANAPLDYVSLQCVVERRDAGGGRSSEGHGNEQAHEHEQAMERRVCVRMYSFAEVAMPLWCALTAYCKAVKTTTMEWRDGTGEVVLRH